MAPPHLKDGRLVIASHNPDKVKEIGNLLAPHGIETLSAAALKLAEPIENGASFEENAQIKAVAAAQASGLPVLADDSGLVIPALGGEPGIHSARWGGPQKDFRIAMERVQLLLSDKNDRRAEFVSVLCLAWLEQGTECYSECFEGRVEGTLVWPPRGDKGFGYDPMFQPEGYDITFGEMPELDKRAISHRAQAFAKLTTALFD